MKDFLDLTKLLGKKAALSYLLPGIVVTWLLIRPIQSLVSEPSVRDLIRIPSSEAALWLAFFVSAWIVGSILKLIGSLLDRPVYDWFFKRIVKRSKNDLLKKAKETIHRDLGDSMDWDRFDYFNYVISFVKAEGIEEGIKEIDEYIGNSKLFRSVAVTMLGIFATFILLNQMALAIGALVFSLVALWNYCTDRWNSTQRAYEYYLIARSKQGQKVTE